MRGGNASGMIGPGACTGSGLSGSLGSRFPTFCGHLLFFPACVARSSKWTAGVGRAIDGGFGLDGGRRMTVILPAVVLLPRRQPPQPSSCPCCRSTDVLVSDGGVTLFAHAVPHRIAGMRRIAVLMPIARILVLVFFPCVFEEMLNRGQTSTRGTTKLMGNRRHHALLISTVFPTRTSTLTQTGTPPWLELR